MNIFMICLLCTSVSSIATAELAIITHPSYQGGELTAVHIKKLFMGKSKFFPNGDKSEAIDQKVGSAARAVFVSSILETNEAKLSRHWSKLIFSGKGKPPNVLDGDEAIKRWVGRNPAGIGYVDASQVDESVKVLLIVD
jgi:ABC-type phosphate transport system substrate-binding protein